jgi:hypothetical protein
MKNIICRLFTHDLRFNATSLPTKAWCKRCKTKFKLIANPKPTSEDDLTIWEEIK